MKNLIKIILLLLGIIILVDAIIYEIDGVGRFAMISCGVLFSLVGGCLSFKKQDK